MTHRAAGPWLALAACAALAAACSAFAPRSDASRFYFLTPLAATSPPPGAGSGEAAVTLAVGLAEIRFPTYLDRPELATRVAANELIFSNVARWAEPLAPGFARVLAVDLDAQLGAASVVRSPWYSAARLNCVLAVEVDHFEADTSRSAPDSTAPPGSPGASGSLGAGGSLGSPGSALAGGDAVLVARWRILDALGKKVLRSGTSIHRRPLAGASPGATASPPAPGTAAVVGTLSQLIEDFSREMAAALRRTVAAASPAGG
jgi:uncharacterized lipoprotein YmbA